MDTNPTNHSRFFARPQKPSAGVSKKEFRGKQLETQQDVINAVHTFMNKLRPQEFRKTILEKWSERIHCCVHADD